MCFDLLLNAVSWDKATREQLRAIAAAPSADRIPGLLRRLYEALDKLYKKK